MVITPHKYPFAINDDGKPFYIGEVTQENRRHTRYHCYGCGAELFPVLCTKKESHFRHEKDAICDPDKYLHEYARAAIKKRFDESDSFIVQYHTYQECQQFNTCQLRQDHKWERCSFHGLYKLDLKKFYDTCTPEKGFYEETPNGKRRYVADLKLTSSESDERPPTILEVWVNHECTEEKKNSHAHIIEIKITTEKDASRAIIESNDDAKLPIRFYGFKDFVSTEPQYTFKHIKALPGLNGTVIATDESSCGEYIHFDPKSIFEVVVSNDSLKSDEYASIFSAMLYDAGMGISYKCNRFCRLFNTIRKSDGLEYVRCKFANRYRCCPCVNYDYDSEKSKAYIEKMKKNDIAIWSSHSARIE